MIWFAKTPTLIQPILTIPVIGFISLYQAIIIFGLGMPSMFLTMQATGELFYGAVPLAIFTIFALIRPPMISYEARLWAMIRFTLFGNKKKKPRKKRSSRFGLPSSSMVRPKSKDQSIRERPAVEKLTVPISHNKLMQISITLRNRNGSIMPNKRVRILLDKKPIMTEVSTQIGGLTVILEHDECIGTRTVSVAEVDEHGNTGELILERVITFVAS